MRMVYVSIALSAEYYDDTLAQEQVYETTVESFSLRKTDILVDIQFKEVPVRHLTICTGGVSHDSEL